MQPLARTRGPLPTLEPYRAPTGTLMDEHTVSLLSDLLADYQVDDPAADKRNRSVTGDQMQAAPDWRSRYESPEELLLTGAAS